LYGWIEPFFEQSEPALEPGQIWLGQPIGLPPRRGLKLEKIDPKDDRKLAFKVTGRTGETFDHPPVHSLGLRSDEAVVVAKAKRDRPVVVLGGTTATRLGGTTATRLGGAAGDAGTVEADAARDAGTVMVVPVDAANGYDEQTRRRVSRYEFANAFYLPAWERPRFAEGFARLDHTQPVRLADLAEPLGLKLSADALDALVEWFVAFATDRRPDDSLILEYRREQLGRE
jgi:hypothetical protein